MGINILSGEYTDLIARAVSDTDFVGCRDDFMAACEGFTKKHGTSSLKINADLERIFDELIVEFKKAIKNRDIIFCGKYNDIQVFLTNEFREITCLYLFGPEWPRMKSTLGDLNEFARSMAIVVTKSFLDQNIIAKPKIKDDELRKDVPDVDMRKVGEALVIINEGVRSLLD